jgi:hypothetical protein
MAMTGWLARREREVVVYLIEKPLPALPAVGRAAQFLPAGGVIVASAENWNITGFVQSVFQSPARRVHPISTFQRSCAAPPTEKRSGLALSFAGFTEDPFGTDRRRQLAAADHAMLEMRRYSTETISTVCAPRHNVRRPSSPSCSRSERIVRKWLPAS